MKKTIVFSKAFYSFPYYWTCLRPTIQYRATCSFEKYNTGVDFDGNAAVIRKIAVTSTTDTEHSAFRLL